MKNRAFQLSFDIQFITWFNVFHTNIIFLPFSLPWISRVIFSNWLNLLWYYWYTNLYDADIVPNLHKIGVTSNYDCNRKPSKFHKINYYSYLIVQNLNVVRSKEHCLFDRKLKWTIIFLGTITCLATIQQTTYVY